MMKSIVAACMALVILDGCNKYGGASRYCEREQRVIPDGEIKGRLLLAIRKKDGIWGELPNSIETYLKSQLLENSSDAQVALALAQYARENPSCCEFKYNFDLFENYWDGDGPGFSNSEYFANFYVYYKPSDIRARSCLIESNRDSQVGADLIQPAGWVGGQHV